MLKYLTVGLILSFASFGLNAQTMTSLESSYSVQETADRFEDLIKSNGLTLFARIDHQKNATGIGMDLRPTQLIIFGNPKVGTPLMQCSQNVAIDLPQKVLISEDADNKVWLSYNNPSYLKERHEIESCDEILNKISAVLAKLSAAAISE